MTPTPKPPTRLTVAGGPKAQPHLSMAPVTETKPDPYRMAHPTKRTAIAKTAEVWGALIIVALFAILYLVFNGSVS